MADAATPTKPAEPIPEPKAPEADPYDIKPLTEINPETDPFTQHVARLEAAKAAEKPAEEAAPEAKAERARGPDGKFISTKEAEEPKEAKAPSKHTAYWQNKARAYRVPEEHIESLEPDELKDWLHSLDRQWEWEQRNQATKAPAAEPEKPKADDELPEWDKGFVEKYEEEFVGPLKKQFLAQQKQIKQLQERLNQSDQQSLAQQQQMAYDMVDSWFAESKDTFGAGSRHQIEQQSPSFRKRLAVLKEMTDIGQGQLNRRVFEQACANLGYSTKSGAAAPREFVPDKKKVEDWNSNAALAPSHRNGSEEPPGPRRLEKKLTEYFREHKSENNDAETLNLFPK